MTDTILDLRHLRCPMPVLRARKALARMASGQTIAVHCTDPLAEIDIPHLVRESGDVLVGTERHDAVSIFTIRKA